MSDEIKNQDVNEVEDLAVNPIADEDLESVAGGRASSCTNGCNATGCCTTLGEAEAF